MSTRRLAGLVVLFVSTVAAHAQCSANLYLYQGTIRDSSNDMQGQAYVYAEIDAGAWNATLSAAFDFQNTQEQNTQLSSGSASGSIVSDVNNDTANPHWFTNAALQPNGQGYYFVSNSAAVSDSCGDYYQIGPVNSLLHPVYLPTIGNLPYNNTLWYFGPGSSQSIPTWNGGTYYQYANLTFSSNCQSGDTCTDTPQWSSAGNAITLSCTSCAAPTLQSSSTGTCNADNEITASIGGFSSAANLIIVASPKYLSTIASLNNTSAYNSGYASQVYWYTYDNCQPADALETVPLHEEFGASTWNSIVTAGWPSPSPTGSAAFNDGQYVFYDTIAAYGSSYNPQPYYGGSPATTVLLSAPQTWYIGSQTLKSSQGVAVSPPTGIYYYQNWGDSH